MACFADIIHLTANLPMNLPLKFERNHLRFDRIMVMNLWPRFLAHPVEAYGLQQNQFWQNWYRGQLHLRRYSVVLVMTIIDR